MAKGGYTPKMKSVGPVVIGHILLHFVLHLGDVLYHIYERGCLLLPSFFSDVQGTLQMSAVHQIKRRKTYSGLLAIPPVWQT